MFSDKEEVVLIGGELRTSPRGTPQNESVSILQNLLDNNNQPWLTNCTVCFLWIHCMVKAPNSLFWVLDQIFTLFLTFGPGCSKSLSERIDPLFAFFCGEPTLSLFLSSTTLSLFFWTHTGPSGYAGPCRRQLAATLTGSADVSKWATPPTADSAVSCPPAHYPPATLLQGPFIHHQGECIPFFLPIIPNEDLTLTKP